MNRAEPYGPMIETHVRLLTHRPPRPMRHPRPHQADDPAVGSSAVGLAAQRELISSRSLQGVRGESQILEGPVEMGVEIVSAIGSPAADRDGIDVHADLGAQCRKLLGDAAGP